MFTGIIEAIGTVQSRSKHGDQTIVRISRPESFDDLKPGSSIACDGICLTVLDFDPASFTVQIMNETVNKSTAGSWINGYKVNLERALKLGARLDGHWVQGHIDRKASLLEASKLKDALYLKIELNSADKALIVPQGSVTVNGVSLTVAELGSGWFKVALIGHTLEHSNLSLSRSGTLLNLEFDILGKYLLNLKNNTGISREWLYEKGF
ncbi:MAG TPA: riboflavin synthase [Candidatus Cloacimonadota bacterium]|nr:riboflavin synthase [Candidatus Cloacimonadota bacterium]